MPRSAPTFAALGLAVLLATGPETVFAQSCPGNADALGVARTVEIDTTGGPGFGFEHYKAHDFLQNNEVVLTFDDGPQARHTKSVLDALAKHCTKATFFSIGKMALGLPEHLREVARAGHTVGTHTWSHANISKIKKFDDAKAEIERGVSAVKRAMGPLPVAPFFRYPFLRDSRETLEHLASRNIAVFSTDVDSFDFRFRRPADLVKSVMSRLEKKGKGILLLHDIQPVTASGLLGVLDALKAGGYKIVHMVPKTQITTLAEFDELVEKDVRGLPAAGSDRPTSSIVRTIEAGQSSGTTPLGPPAKR